MRSLSVLVLLLTLGAGRAEADADAEVAMAQDAQARGLPLAALFHAARAKQLGREVAVNRLDLDALWRDLPTRPAVTLPDECGWLRSSIEATYPAARANVQIDARLSCSAGERSWDEYQDYTWYEEIPYETTRTVPGESRYVSSSCTRAGQSCNVIHGQNVCHSTTEFYECGSYVAGEDRTETVTEIERIPHQGNHLVSRRTLSLSVRGSVSNATATAPVAYERATDEIQFSDEHGSQAFTTSLEGLVGDSSGAVIVAVQELLEPVRRNQREIELAAAASAGDKLTAEEHRLRAWTLGDPATKLAKAYGVTDHELAALLVTVGFQIPQDLQVALFLEDQARGERRSRPRRTSLFTRFFHAGTAFTLERSTRDGDSLRSLGYGVRVDHGWRLRKTLDYALGLSAGAGTDDAHGTRFDARAGVALGLRSKRYQLAYVLGLGVTGVGVRMVGAGESTLETKPGVFHGVDLRLRAKPFGLDARVTQGKGGPLGDELRASARVVWVFGRYLVGADAAIQRYDGDAELSEQEVTTLGVTFGLEP